MTGRILNCIIVLLCLSMLGCGGSLSSTESLIGFKNFSHRKISAIAVRAGNEVTQLHPDKSGGFGQIKLPVDSEFNVSVVFEDGTRMEDNQLADDPEFTVTVYDDRITRIVRRSGAL